MKLNRKLWTAALAVAMTTPSAMAAQDTAGMHYTSASEGFYASIRLRYVSNGGSKDGGADIENGSSRFGVRGTNDLGGGLEGFYQYEMGVGTEDGNSDMSTRVAHVGLRGDFGSVVAGAFWPETYNWVYGSTDVANRHSGYLTGNFGQYRTSKSIQYTTPDLNGFRGAVLLKADSSADGETHGHNPKKNDDRSIGEGGNKKDDNDVDHWSLAAAYDIAGFSMGASYSVYPDARNGVGYGHHKTLNGIVSASANTAMSVTVGVDALDPLEDYTGGDLKSWAVKLGYSQDNWYVNGWYGKINDGGSLNAFLVDPARDSVNLQLDDTQVFSIAGGITVDKVGVYAVYENREKSAVKQNDKSIVVESQDESRTTLGVQYTLGSNSWTWVEYAGRDLDSDASADNDFSILMRVLTMTLASAWVTASNLRVNLHRERATKWSPFLFPLSSPHRNSV